jgi:hypothetical protein
MLVAALDGRAIEVRRKWLPWRLRRRQVTIDPTDAINVLDAADDLGSFAVSVVVAVVWVLFGGIVLTIALFASEALLLLLLLIPLFAAARFLLVLPWAIEAANGDTVLGVEQVRGWRDSSQRIREIAAAYELGQDPFAP